MKLFTSCQHSDFPSIALVIKFYMFHCENVFKVVYFVYSSDFHLSLEQDVDIYDALLVALVA